MRSIISLITDFDIREHTLFGVRVWAVLSLLSALFVTPMAESTVFPVPDVIKHNVAFWIRVYTEVGLKEGLLHDTENPQIVYEKLTAGDKTGKARSDYIDGRRKIYTDAIAIVRDSAPEKWGDVEKRVADIFKLAPDGAIKGAENRVRFQMGQRERFKQGLERSSVYLDTISAILKQHGVPDELKYLPHVESSFDTEAYSKVGAAGLWQFMRATGRLYMRVDYMIDERNDPVISTNAAAKFLRANYDMLKTWPLAITAYNHGPHGMRRAVEAVGSSDIAVILQKHESASFRFASKNFYSCFVAVLQIMENPNKYFKGVHYKPKFQAASVKLPHAMTPKTICALLSITEQQFKQLNPGFRPVVFSQQKLIPSGYAVNLPTLGISGEEILTALKRAPAATVAATSSSQTFPALVIKDKAVKEKERDIETTDGYYTVMRGDNLYGIARRLGVAMADLAAVNNITNSKRIYVGQALLIPTPGASQPVQVAAQTQHPPATAQTPPTAPTQTAQIDSIKTEPTKTDTIAADKQVAAAVKQESASVVEPQKTTATNRSMIRDLHITVSSSYDTAWTKPVAESVKQAVAVARDTVKLTSSVIDTTKSAASTKEARKTIVADTAAVLTATKTVIDTLSPAALMEAESPTPSKDSAGKPPIDTRFDAFVYDLWTTVAPGDSNVQVRISVDETIGHFADWMRVGADDIRNRNNIAPNAAVPIGRVIFIPIRSSSFLKRLETGRLQYHMAIEEDFFARYDVTDFERKNIKSGDNLWRICSEAQIPMWLLKKFNRNVNIYNLKIGDTLWIPKISAKNSAHEAPIGFEPIITESETAE